MIGIEKRDAEDRTFAQFDLFRIASLDFQDNVS